MDREMKIPSLKTVFESVRNVFFADNTAKNEVLETLKTNRQQRELERIRQKAEDHLAARREQGLPEHGKATFKPGAVISEKFWGVHADGTLPTQSRAAETHNGSLEFEAPNANLLEAALKHKQEQDAHMRERKTFAGIPFYKIDEAFEKVANAISGNDDPVHVAELDFEQGQAFVETFSEKLSSFGLQLNTQKMQVAI